MRFASRYLVFTRPLKALLYVSVLAFVAYAAVRMLCCGGGACIFCEVLTGDRLVYKDEHVAAFEDIRPAAPFHYLVIPLDHIENGKSLLGMGEKGAALLRHMAGVGEKLLKDKGYSISQSRLGFHWPPFNSVNHLHLHVIAPTTAFKSSFHKLEFKVGTPWFKTIDWVLERIANQIAA